jgi:hypothetical protein
MGDGLRPEERRKFAVIKIHLSPGGKIKSSFWLKVIKLKG